MGKRSRTLALMCPLLAASLSCSSLDTGAPGANAPSSAGLVAAGPQSSAAETTAAARSLASRFLGGVEARSDFEAPSRKPNFLMITLDDARISDLASMSRTQRLLVDQGMSFDAIAPTPICVPARASILTGQYAHNHGAETIFGDNGGFESFKDQRTLPVWLRRAGYDTLFVGKYLNEYGPETGSATYVPPGWTDWRGSVGRDTYKMHLSTLNDNGVVRSERQYQTDAWRDEAQDMIRDRDRRRKPWFLWLNYAAPHHAAPADADDPPKHGWPVTVQTTYPAPRHRDMFRGTKLPRSPNLFKKERGAPQRSPSSLTAAWNRDGRAAVREAYQQRLESLQAVDEAIAANLKVLRKTRQLRNTYIILHSDNGFNVGNHRQYGKLWHYRESSSIPVVMRGPGIRRGVTSPTTLTNPALPVSIAAMAGAEPLRTVDGVNVFAHLDGASRGQRVVPIEAWPVKGGKQRLFSGVRVGKWTYARFREGQEEVFRHTTDPAEMVNLAAEPRFERQVRKLRRLARAYRNCAGDECPKTFWRRR